MDSAQQQKKIDPSHPSIALFSQKLYSGGVAVVGASGTRGTHVQRHVGKPSYSNSRNVVSVKPNITLLSGCFHGSIY